MPPEVMCRSKRNQGNLLIVKFVLLIVVSFVLAEHFPATIAFLGLRLKQPLRALLIGVLAAAFLTAWTWSMFVLARKIRLLPGEAPIFVLRESTQKILLIVVFGAFAEELWRALALTALHRAGTSFESAVLLTSLSFGVGHVLSFQSLGAALGRALRPALGGVFLAALFLWSGTLLTPFLTHVLVNSAAALMQRKHALARQTSEIPTGP